MSNEVERFTHVENWCGLGEPMAPDRNGAYVRHSDYAALAAEVEKLRAAARFGVMVFDRSRDEGWCGDVDAVDVQDYAQECGLIAPRVVEQACGGNGCPCEPGDECFWETDAMATARAAIDAARKGQ